MYRVGAIMVAVLCVEAGLMGGAFFCRDPDTGKLHPINTTWRSTSFCGNYHCKLRRKNLTQSTYGPLREINITNFGLGKKFDRNVHYDENKIKINKEEIDVQRINNMMANDVNVSYDDHPVETKPKTLSTDRYLSEQEIESISTILHTVKKSDLDAVLEIFNLAHDIYKEIDKTNPEALIQETLGDFKQDLGYKSKVSYWYEPINHGKQRDFADNTAQEDFITASSNLIPATTEKPRNSASTPHITTAKPTTKSGQLYDGTIGSNDYGKIPYYYPISNFQRAATYVHTPADVGYNHPTPKSLIPRVETSKFQKDIRPSIYLPYPFSQIPRYYNTTYPQTLDYKKHYIDYIDMKLKISPELEDIGTNIKYLEIEKTDNNNQFQKDNSDNAILVNPDLESYHEMDLKPADDDKEKEMLRLSDEKRVDDEKPDWQTDPISKQILDDARAHIERTRFLKPFFSRKKIILERVGKVIKLDDIGKRTKRHLQPELYEVYIERITCQTDDTVPGYFRYGNITEPYPECCPQRIL